jgi:quercetin dioxygenase-like cupin family protein
LEKSCHPGYRRCAPQQQNCGTASFFTIASEIQREDEVAMSANPTRPFRVAYSSDRHAEPRSVGIGTLTFKVTTADSNGSFLVVEIAHHAKGGPPRHLHQHQDEWFHVAEGEYIVEIGEERYRLGPGDSAFGPRGVPHCWTNVSDGPGRITFVLAPAGPAEAFFLEITKANAMAPTDPAFWRPFDMALVGPPLTVE